METGYGTAIFEIDGIQASQKALNGCEEDITGTVTLNVQDTSSEGKS